VKTRGANNSILVTGGCGYIGSHVTRQLSEAGYRVVVIDNLSTGFRASLLHGEELIIGDIRNPETLDHAFDRHKFSAVFHFAASIVVPESMVDPLGYYDNNSFGTLRLLLACAKHNVDKFIYSSTAAVYADVKNGLVREDSPLMPSTPYGRSKLMGGVMLADFASISALRFVILRYFNVAGADPLARIGQRFPDATHLIKVACETALGLRPEMKIYGTDYPTPDGTGVRDFIHVEDLASAHLSALKYLDAGKPSCSLNCGYGKGHSVKEVIQAVQKEMGPFRVVSAPRRQGDLASVVSDNRAILRTLDWKPQYANLETIVRHSLAFERKLLPRKAA